MLRALTLISVCLAGSLSAQLPTIRLSEPERRFPEPFSSVGGVVERPDGRTLVAGGLG